MKNATLTTLCRSVLTELAGHPGIRPGAGKDPMTAAGPDEYADRG